MISIWYPVQRCVALSAMVLLLPLFAVLFVVVKATSKGPFLYSQLRPGLMGAPMRIWKIRTMNPGADRNTQNARCVGRGNPDVTSVGRVLRKLKLDELPQLWNIVAGQMAFVGPRPIAFPLYQELCESIPGFERRTDVRPGLSNVGQVSIEENAQGEGLLDDWMERFEAEKHYLANRSVCYDCVVICLTVLFLIRKVWKMRSKRKRDDTVTRRPMLLSHQSHTA